MKHSRQKIWFQALPLISGAPSFLLTSRFSRRLKPFVVPATYAWHWPRRMIKMPQRNASYHQLQRFVFHLRFHVDDPPRNSLWKWKPSPASAARKCGDVIHFASTRSPGRAVSPGGWGDGNARAMNKHSDWTDFSKGGATSEFASFWLAERATKAFHGSSPKQKGKWKKVLLLSWRVRLCQINQPQIRAVKCCVWP